MSIEPLPDRIKVYAWSTPRGSGNPVGGAYTRDNWLPFVGPTAFLLASVVAQDIAKNRATSRVPLQVDVDVLGRRIGVTNRKVLARAVSRLGWHELAKWSGEPGTSPLEIKMMWPAVPQRLQKRLPRP